MRKVVLGEWEERELALDPADVETLLSDFRRAVRLRPLGRDRYRLRTKAYVGTIVTPTLQLRIVPKCGLSNLLWMLGWGHGVVEHLDEWVDVEAIDDVREYLLAIFADQVHRLVRGGVRRGYVEEADDLPVLRGRLDLGRHLRRAPSATLRLPCRFEDYTADLPFNQVIAETLRFVGTAEHAPTARRLRRLRQTFSALTRRRFSTSDIDAFEYDRLSQHYRPIHALCRILLEAAGAEHEDGELPLGNILLDMNRLFERFVAAWLAQHLPDGWSVQAQARRSLDRGRVLALYPDLILEYRGQPRLVVDTKYKIDSSGVPKREDAYQALAYCRALGLETCVLVYPDRAESRRFVVADGANEVRSDGFVLAGGVASIERGLAALTERLVMAGRGSARVATP